MNEEIIMWTNRILTGLICAFVAFICEKYNFRPCLCFILAFITLISLSFIFGIVRHLLGGGE